MKKRFAGLAAALFLALPAAAQFQAGVNQTLGSNSYKETNFHATIFGGGLSLAPELDVYTQNGVPTYKTVSARGGLDTPIAGVGLTAGTTLKENGYSNAFGGADIAFSLSASGLSAPSRIGGNSRSDAPIGAGLARVDFGAGALVTRHSQDSLNSITQADYDGFVGAAFIGTLLSARLTKSAYDHTPNLATDALPNRVSVVGLMPIAGAYPDASLLLKAQMSLPLIAPYISYTRTTYETTASGFTPGTTRAYGAGLSVGLQMLEVNGAVQHVSITGGSDTTYYSVGAGIRF